MKEANIIKKFRDKLPGHWTSIENSVTSGVPDYTVTRNGQLRWIEFKRLYGCDIIVRPLQRNWMIREVRHSTSSCYVAWWDNGPVVIHASNLLDINPVEKRGKLYYNVSESSHLFAGWELIDKILFGERNV